jgi:hypothetical protein
MGYSKSNAKREVYNNKHLYGGEEEVRREGEREREREKSKGRGSEGGKKKEKEGRRKRE